MDRQELVWLNEAIASAAGQKIMQYMTAYMIECAARPGCNAEWVKGMGMLVDHVCDVERQFQKKLNNERK